MITKFESNPVTANGNLTEGKLRFGTMSLDVIRKSETQYTTESKPSPHWQMIAAMDKIKVEQQPIWPAPEDQTRP